MKKIKVKAVIFDLDGVVTQTMGYHVRAFQKAFQKEENTAISAHDVLIREGMPGEMLVPELLKLYGKPLQKAKVEAILEAKKIHFKQIVRQRFVPGARTFIDFLLKKQIRLALATGSSRKELSLILPDEWQNKFDVLITGDDVTQGKPHPDPFRQAQRKLKVKSSEAIVVENAPLGIEAAHKAGLKCIVLATTLEKRFLKDAEVVYESYRQMSLALEISPMVE